MKAWIALRYTLPERRRIFHAGLKRLGYRVMDGLPGEFGDHDILVTWNRCGIANTIAAKFEERGQPVLVTENAAWGNDFAGEHWYSLAMNRHNTAGMFPIGDHTRWDELAIDLPPFRTEGETVLLPQRGIGSKPVAMPKTWLHFAKQKYGGRVRSHPGTRPTTSLEDDLKDCGRVVTWGSGAAIKALMLGIPVISDMPQWIGEQQNTEESRLAMFRQLAWAQSRLSEIESGAAFERLLRV